VKRPAPDRFRAVTALAYLLLLGVYLVYWSHVAYFVDDWFLLKRFGEARERGLAGVADFAAAAAQNRIYGVFRAQWLSILWGFLVTAVGGDSARFNFAALLLLHAACAWVLCQTLARLGVDRGVAFLAGALYLLAPSAHFALVTYLANPFFVFSMFWSLLLLLWFAGGARSHAAGVACAVAGLFSGEQVFLLLWALVPLAWLCFPRRGTSRQICLDVPNARRRPMLTVWASLGLALAVYLLWINRVPVGEAGFSRRYQWTWEQLQKNADMISTEWLQLSGITADAVYRVSPGPVDLAMAGSAAVIVGFLLWNYSGSKPHGGPHWRLGLFAACGVLIVYVPVLWIAGGFARFRYHYAASPFLGLGLAAICGTLPRPASALLGGVAAGLFSLNATADLRQCWIPQSGHHRALESQLRSLPNVAAGDILVISATPFATGTAQHFTLHSSLSANPFAERATGAAPLEVARELFLLHDRLMLYQRDYQRPLHPEDLRRTHVLVWSGRGSFSQCHWVALELPSGRFRLEPLKGTAPLEPPADFLSEQLALRGPRIYFPKKLGPGQPAVW